jgi:adenylate cyclase
MDSTKRRLAAVWFADIVGYTRLSSTDETAAIRLVGLFQEIAREQTERHGGTVVKFTGDGLLAHAPSAGGAIEAMTGLRSEFEERSAQSGHPALLRIGGHLGDVVVMSDGDVLGDGVNVASRLQTEAGPGRIFVSEDLWRQCRQRAELEFVALGLRRIKGIGDPVRIYELSPPAGSPIPSDDDTGEPGASSSLAILPFEVVGTLEEAEFLASGIHNDLLTQLSKVPGLTVISRTSVRGYRGTEKPIPQIAGELNVGTIIEGAVQSAGSRIRLTVQLIDGKTDTHRWADHFDRELTTESLFEIQTELTERIVESLHAELADTTRESGPGTESMEAYRLVVEGRMQFDRKTEDGLMRAIEIFRQAVDEDPEYGLAWVGLTDSLALTADYGYGNRDELNAAANEAVVRALDLLPDSAEVHSSLGLIAEASQDAPTALREYSLAIRLGPSYADAHSWHGWVSLVVGRGEQGLASATRSVQLNPLSAEAVSNVALSLLAVERPEEALTEARRASVLSPGYTTSAYYEGLALYDLGEFDEAVAVLTPLSLAEFGELSTPWASMGADAALALAQVAAGKREDARRTLDTIDPESYPFEAGVVYAGLGDTEKAFAHFARVENAPYGPALIFHHHFRDVWAELSDDPRFQRLDAQVARSWRMPLP